MRIGLCGTQSVGKTTLVKELKQRKELNHYTFFTERSKYLNSLGVPLNKESTLNGQLLFMAERAKELLEQDMITDRTSVDVAAFTATTDKIEAVPKAGILYLLSKLALQYDLIIYIPPTIPLVDNGVRDMDKKYRMIIDKQIKHYLKHFDIPKDKLYVLKSDNVKDKVAEIMKEIKRAAVKKILNYSEGKNGKINK